MGGELGEWIHVLLTGYTPIQKKKIFLEKEVLTGQWGVGERGGGAHPAQKAQGAGGWVYICFVQKWLDAPQLDSWIKTVWDLKWV